MVCDKHWIGNCKTGSNVGSVVLGDGRKGKGLGADDMTMRARVDNENTTITLNDALHGPSLSKNLISHSKATSNGVKATF